MISFFMKAKLAAVAALLLSAFPASAQFPQRPIEIVVPFPAGGGTDLGTRVIAKALQERWGVQVKVVNLPGGNTAPGVEEVMRAPPDGYKVLMDGMSSSSLLGLVVPNLPYKITDRSFVTLTAQTPMVLVVAKESPLNSLEDVVAALKKDPAAVSWTSLGGTGVSDMAFRRLFKAAGVEFAKTRAVVVRGGAEAAIQTAGGHVLLGSGSNSSFASLVGAGRLKVLTVFAKERSKLTPDVPSTNELGYPDVFAIQWNGISGPPNMNAEAQRAWHSAMQAVLAETSVIEGLARVGIEPLSGDGAAMRKIVEEELQSLPELIGAKPAG